VRKDGRVKFQGRIYFLSEALAGETTGWVEVDEDIWRIGFGPGRSGSLRRSRADSLATGFGG